MLKTISASNLRIQIRWVLEEVQYTQADYIIEKFGQPAAVIISIDDYNFLQAARQQTIAAPPEEAVNQASPSWQKYERQEANP